VGQIFFAENKDSFLLPDPIQGQWLLYHRPVHANGIANIWVSYSNDLVHWGKHKCIMEGRGGIHWDGYKLGCSPPLVKTEFGWLMIYHASRMTPAGCIYRCGLALLDLEDPSKVIARSRKWFFAPEESYEMFGDVGNVIFLCGVTTEGDELRMYYGAADTSIAVAVASISGLLEILGVSS